jgi:hypothetical protein
MGVLERRLRRTREELRGAFLEPHSRDAGVSRALRELMMFDVLLDVRELLIKLVEAS